MSTTEINEIKLNLISWINQLSDTNLLTFLDGLKSSKSKGDWWDQLSENQRKIVLAGIKDADLGNTISSKLFWEKLTNA
ncbi:MAG: hypothetical protein IPH62_07480 [Ignavibacteriae bacterium]|nr:hypothetical protein [Ignavibacteriota bacterium]